MKSYDIIIIAGAPASGKSTIAELLKKELQAPEIDFGNLRDIHLFTPDWSDATDEDEAMTFEHLAFMLDNYLKHGYRNILIHDFKDSRIAQLPDFFKEKNYAMITLTVSDDALLTKRIQARESGFRDVPKALASNQWHMTRPLFPREHRVDSTGKPEGVVEEILKLL
jgi:adenylate kinase family enzyme